MKPKLFILFGLLVVVSTVLWWLRAPQPNHTHETAAPIAQPIPSPPPEAAATPAAVQPIEERRKAAAEEVKRILATSITFYGKVVDQNGDSVPDANVGYSALDKFMEPGSSYSGKSDEGGLFSITGIS